MFIAILGRQAHIGLAELERTYGHIARYSSSVAVLDAEPDIQRLGGVLKTGRVVAQLPHGEWRQVHKEIIRRYTDTWQTVDFKVTLGMSAYDLRVTPRDIQRTGLELKKALKTHSVSLRLIPNTAIALNTATSHHNKLGLSPNKVELLVVRGDDGSLLIAESTGAQNITALAARDQARPKRDAFVGMLPPKLAMTMINLAIGKMPPEDDRQLVVLDPFCGTGVVLQEASLRGYAVYGTDLSEKMIDYSKQNLAWLTDKFHVTKPNYQLAQADAMTASWRPPVDAVACEAYLGQPFSAPPSPAKLREVRGNCNHIISSFLANLAPQITAGTPLCVAVPAWRGRDGAFTHLPLTSDHELHTLGYRRLPLKSVRPHELLYYREDQVVARELLLIEKA